MLEQWWCGEMKLIILGDFNLNENMKYQQDYSHKAYYEELMQTFEPLGLIQLVNFETWRRLVNGVWRSSIIEMKNVFLK